jgi:hypothetical protein
MQPYDDAWAYLRIAAAAALATVLAMAVLETVPGASFATPTRVLMLVSATAAGLALCGAVMRLIRAALHARRERAVKRL